MTIRENRLFLGNPGAGKSTLINCLVGAYKLKSGLSWGRGLTQDYQRVDHDGVAYMDTPGLADTAIADQAASAITTALKQGGQYKLFFLLRLQNGRVVSEDLVTLERVLGAIDMAASKIRFSVVFNNVDKKQYKQLTQPESDAFKSVHSVVNGLQFKTDAFCFIPAITELDEASDAVVKLPQHVRGFMDETAPSMRIKPSVVRAVDPTGIAQQARLIQEEMEKLLKSRATMMTAMATQQQQNEAAMQRERASHAAQLQSVGRRGSLSSPTHHYAAYPQTPPPAPANSETENDAIVVRKKVIGIIVAIVGVAVLILAVAIVIMSVAATRGDRSPTGSSTSGDDTASSTQGSDAASDFNWSSPQTPSPVPTPVPLPTTATPPPTQWTPAPSLPSAAAIGWEPIGCVVQGKLTNKHVVLSDTALSIEQAAAIVRGWKTYFAFLAIGNRVVAFNVTIPNANYDPDCLNTVPLQRVWTVYKAVDTSVPILTRAPAPNVSADSGTLTTKDDASGASNNGGASLTTHS